MSKLLARRGIEVRTATRLERLDAESATLSDGERIETHTLVWTTGVRAHPLLAAWGLPVDERGRVKVDEQLRVEGRDATWAVGDCARVVERRVRVVRTRRPASTPSARRASSRRTSAANPSPYAYRMIGQGATLGRFKGVAEIFGIRLRGFPGWFATRSYHLYQLPLFTRKLRVVTDWTVAMFFRRDIAQLGTLGHPKRLD